MFDDIKVVVQGPVHSLHGRSQEIGVTKKSILSIKKYLPGAKIILSTWKGQSLDGLEFDDLIESKDPGFNIRQYKNDGTPKHYNNNRQIVSTLAVLKKVTTKYAVKLRSDNYLCGNDFVELQSAFTERCSEFKFLTERVVVCNTFTRKYAKGQRVAFHLSDFFYFGLTSDLLSIWDIPLIPDYTPTDKHPYNLASPNYLIDCTQLFWLSTLAKFNDEIHLSHLLDNTTPKIHQSNICFANNLIVASAKELGLNLGDKFTNKKVRISKKKGLCAFLSFGDWEYLYKKYCDNNYNISTPKVDRIALILARFIYITPVYLEVKVKAFVKSTLRKVRS